MARMTTADPQNILAVMCKGSAGGHPGRPGHPGRGEPDDGYVTFYSAVLLSIVQCYFL
jgi:hypothetical protein